jgi:hypothetical protein
MVAIGVLVLMLGLAGQGLLSLLAWKHRWTLFAALGTGHRLALAGAAGWVLLHGLLTAYWLLGVPWRLGALLPPVLLLALLPLFDSSFSTQGWWPVIDWESWKRRAREPGVLAVLITLGALAGGILTYGLTNPDFVYHWGIKGHRFFLARGLDLPFLDLAGNWPVHPEYPNLLPELFAATALATGRFIDQTLPLWSVVFLGLIALAIHGTLRRAGNDRRLAAAGAAAVTALLAMFAAAHRLPGGADELIALALLLSVAPLAGMLEDASPEERLGADLQIALAMALAASVKLEGVVLAVSIFLAYGVVSARQHGGDGALRQRLPELMKRWLRIVLPALALVLPWLFTAAAHGWFGEPNSGPFQLAHAPAVLSALGQAVLHPSWYGLALPALLALPLLALSRRNRFLRPVLAVCAVQLLVYALIYCTALRQPELWVRSSFPRLLVHVVPTLLTLVCVAACRWARKPEPGET